MLPKAFDSCEPQQLSGHKQITGAFTLKLNKSSDYSIFWGEETDGLPETRSMVSEITFFENRKFRFSKPYGVGDESDVIDESFFYNNIIM
jgi:hypothetical protein